MNKKLWLNKLREEKGALNVFYAVLVTSLLVFLILPLFSYIVEHYIHENKIQKLTDAIDITNIAVYNAINTANYSRTSLTFDDPRVNEIYKNLLSKNLKLNDDLTPREGSIADGQVRVIELIIYTAVPATCPQGNSLNRPTIHAKIIVPMKPNLFRKVILDALGVEYIELVMHVDTELPINN